MDANSDSKKRSCIIACVIYVVLSSLMIAGVHAMAVLRAQY